MESISFPHFDANQSQAHIGLFRNVSNAGELKSRIIAASTTEGAAGDKDREAVNFSFIDARLITSKLHLETAIYQAVLTKSQNGLRTKTVHSEILYYLNPSHNITEAIRRYGVSGGMADLLVVRIGPPELKQAEVEANIKGVVIGDLVPLSELENVTDWSSVKKYHKLNNEAAIKEAQKNPSKERAAVDKIVTSSVAMKSVMG